MSAPTNYDYVYMMLDKNYEDVVVSADCIKDLAKKAGVKRDTIDQTMSRAKRRGTRCKYIRVYVGDDDLEK